MRIAVIGANGFIGKAVYESLLRMHELIEVIPLTRSNFDLTTPENCIVFPEVDCVVHAASKNDGSTYEIFNTNALTAGNVASRLNSAGVKKLIYLSSGAVYGPVEEPTYPGLECNPQGDYAVSKYLGEIKTAEVFTGNLSILRLYFPYGMGQNRQRLIPRLIARLKAGESIVCNHDGGPDLSLTHIDVITELISDLCLKELDSKGRSVNIRNVAGPEIIKLYTLVQALADVLGVEPNITSTGNAPNAVSIAFPDFPIRLFSANEVINKCMDA